MVNGGFQPDANQEQRICADPDGKRGVRTFDGSTVGVITTARPAMGIQKAVAAASSLNGRSCRMASHLRRSVTLRVGSMAGQPTGGPERFGTAETRGAKGCLGPIIGGLD